MQRDHRYEIIPALYETGHIKSFNDIFKYIPKTVVANDMGKKVDRFTTLMNKVGGFTVDEVMRIGHFCGLNVSEMLALIEKEYELQKAKQK
jgi:hypothetical protein